MSESKRASAGFVAWISPEDVPLSLAPLAGGELQVEVHQGAVTAIGKQCRFVWSDAQKKKKLGEKVLAEVEITFSLSRAQINWRFVEAPE